MLGDLFEHYLKEGLDKQLVGRLPFALYLSLLAYPAVLYFDPTYSFGGVSYAVAGTSLVAFVITSYYFSTSASERLANGIFRQDFKAFVSKIRDIYEGKDSIFSDLDKGDSRGVFVVCAACGVSIAVFLSTMFMYALVFFRPSASILGLAILLLTLYVFYEIVKAPLMGEDEGQKGQSALKDMFETWMVTNSMSRFHLKSRTLTRSLIFLGTKFFAPVAHINVPKFAFESTLVYDIEELTNELERMTEKTESKVYLNHEDGLDMKQLLEGQDFPLEKITVFGEKSPREIYPYLLDSKYAYSQGEERKWAGFGVVDSTDSRVIARVFIHKFRAVAAKNRLNKRDEKATPVYVRTKALQFFIIGERGYVEYLKTRIESLSVKVPNELLNVEYDPHPGRD